MLRKSKQHAAERLAQIAGAPCKKFLTTWIYVGHPREHKPASKVSLLRYIYAQLVPHCHFPIKSWHVKLKIYENRIKKITFLTIFNCKRATDAAMPGILEWM